MFGLKYENNDEIKAFVFTVIICSILIIILLIIYILQLSILYLIRLCRGNKRKVYSLSTYLLPKLPNKSLEDSIYFSEILPSVDNLSHGGSFSCSSRSSSVSTISEKIAPQWFPLTTIRKFKSSDKEKSQNNAIICTRLKYVSNDNEDKHQQGKLHILIKNVLSLPAKDYPRYTEAYLVLHVSRIQRKIKGRTEIKVYENQTKNFRNTRDISVDENFIVNNIRKNDVKNLNISIFAYDQDIYTKPSELASVTISLSQKYKELLQKPEVEITSCLKQIQKNIGHLLIGLSYLPTSQRLSLNIVKAANIPLPKNVKETKLSFYTQLFLLTGVTGRSFKRKKLIFNPKENEPFDLNGTISFDIIPNLLDSITLLIILYKKNNNDCEDENFKEKIEDNENINSLAKNIPKDQYLGSIAIGKLVSNYKGKKHWRMMMAAPRRVVTVWHSLK